MQSEASQLLSTTLVSDIISENSNSYSIIGHKGKVDKFSINSMDDISVTILFTDFSNRLVTITSFSQP